VARIPYAILAAPWPAANAPAAACKRANGW